MSWWERAISYITTGLNPVTSVVIGATILTIIIIVAVLWVESKIKNRKD